MALDLIITFVIVLFLIFIIFKIFKKIVKIALTILLVIVVILFSVNYIVKLDAADFEKNMDEGVVYLYKDQFGFETNPYRVINLTEDYMDLMGNKTRVLVYKTGEYEDIELFRESVHNSTLGIMQQVREGNIEIYPRSPFVVCVEKCPDFVWKRYVEEVD